MVCMTMKNNCIQRHDVFKLPFFQGEGKMICKILVYISTENKLNIKFFQHVYYCFSSCNNYQMLFSSVKKIKILEGIALCVKHIEGIPQYE